MVSPGKVNVFNKLHTTITAYPVSKMMMSICVVIHDCFNLRKNKEIFGTVKFIFRMPVTGLVSLNDLL